MVPQPALPGRVAAAKKSKIDPYDVLAEEAADVPPGSEGLFFLPYLAGERTPHADPDARGCFIGLTLKHGRGHLVRAIMEGVTYAMRDSLAIIEELGVPVKQIRASGGGSQSPLWRQIQADVFGQKVVTINAEQGPAYGVALLAAVGAGRYKNIEEACAATIRVVEETPLDRNAKNLRRGFPLYQNLYRSLKDDFKSITAYQRSMSVLCLTEDDVERLLDMPTTITVVEEAFRRLAAGEATNTPRARDQGPGFVFHSMRASASTWESLAGSITRRRGKGRSSWLGCIALPMASSRH